MLGWATGHVQNLRLGKDKGRIGEFEDESAYF